MYFFEARDVTSIRGPQGVGPRDCFSRSESLRRLRLVEPLTERELETLELVCAGLSNDEIARATGIALATVKWHLMNIFGKLGVRRRTQAVAVAIYLDLVRPAWLADRWAARSADGSKPDSPGGGRSLSPRTAGVDPCRERFDGAAWR